MHQTFFKTFLHFQGQLTALGLPGNQLTRVPVQVIVKLIILFPLEDMHRSLIQCVIIKIMIIIAAIVMIIMMITH